MGVYRKFEESPASNPAQSDGVKATAVVVLMPSVATPATASSMDDTIDNMLPKGLEPEQVCEEVRNRCMDFNCPHAGATQVSCVTFVSRQHVCGPLALHCMREPRAPFLRALWLDACFGQVRSWIGDRD